MYVLTYELIEIDVKIFYGVRNQNFNLIKSSFPSLKITGRDNYIFAMGNQEILDILKEKLDNIVDFINKNNDISVNDVENILKLKNDVEKS